MPTPLSSPEELLQHHFVYEIKMLQETYRRCYSEVRTDSDDDKKVRNNALIESFCVHARNLIEFFFRAKKFRELYAPNYAPFERISKDKIEVIYDRLCGQISHLVHDSKGNRRTSYAVAKIKASDRYEILGILRVEIIAFKKVLASGYAHIAPAIPVPLSPFDIPVSDPDATATNSQFVMGGAFYEPPPKS